MEVVIHAHRSSVTDALRSRADEGVRRCAEHLRRAVDADICFARDGVERTVEISLHAPRARRLVACGAAPSHDAALGIALDRLDAQVRRLRSARKRQVHGTELRA